MAPSLWLRTMLPGCSCLELEPYGDLVEAVAYAASHHAAEYAPGGEGLCLPVTAAICHVLAEAGVSDVWAVAGSVDAQAHWWVRVGDRLADATRGQFDDGPIVSPIDADHRYVAEHELRPGWSHEHVVLEAVRAFQFEEAGRQFGEFLLELLRLTARSVRP